MDKLFRSIVQKFQVTKVKENIFINITFFLVILFGFISRLPALDKSLNEFFSFRQAQTAWGAKALLLFDSSGFVTQTPVFGPPFKVPYEFPIYQWIHFILIKFSNLEVDLAGRLLSLLIFQILAIQIYFLTKSVLDRKTAIWAIIIFELTPFGFQWSTAVLIDYFSILLAIVGINTFLRSKHTFVNILAIFILTLSALVKITTFITCVPLVIYLFLHKYKKSHKQYPILVGLVFVPIFIGNLWTNYADTIKSQSQETAWLTSENLFTWNFGTLSARIDPNVWIKILNILDSLTLGFKGSFILVFSLVCYLFTKEKLKSNRINFVMALIISSIIGPLVFINLYYVHDYYFIPLSVFLSIVIPVLFSEILKIGTRIVNFGLISFFLFLVVFTMWISPLGVNYFNNLRTKPSIPERSISISKYTTQEDLVILINCNSWDPTILYYANRRGLIVLDNGSTPRNVTDYNAILKCDETPWTEWNWINLNQWLEVQNDLLIRKN